MWVYLSFFLLPFIYFNKQFTAYEFLLAYPYRIDVGGNQSNLEFLEIRCLKQGKVLISGLTGSIGHGECTFTKNYDIDYESAGILTGYLYKKGKASLELALATELCQLMLSTEPPFESIEWDSAFTGFNFKATKLLKDFMITSISVSGYYQLTSNLSLSISVGFTHKLFSWTWQFEGVKIRNAPDVSLPRLYWAIGLRYLQ